MYDILADVNSQSIYHATTSASLFYILKDNKLKAYSSYTYAEDKVAYGISFTRSLQYAKFWDKSDAIISADYLQLRLDGYKLIPRGAPNYLSIRLPPTRTKLKMEEFLVIGKSKASYISNFSDYINFVYIRRSAKYKNYLEYFLRKYFIDFSYF